MGNGEVQREPSLQVLHSRLGNQQGLQRLQRLQRLHPSGLSIAFIVCTQSAHLAHWSMTNPPTPEVFRAGLAHMSKMGPTWTQLRKHGPNMHPT